MDITFVLMILLITFLILAGAVVLYLHFYKRRINSVLREKRVKCRKMLPPHVLVSFLPVLLILVAILTVILDMKFDLSQSRLTTKEEILADARIGREDMRSEISVSSDVAAVLSFSEDLRDSEYRVYVNKNSNHPDYVFRRGGDLTAVERAAYLLEYEGTFILASLNTCSIAEIHCENGTIYFVEPGKPFVLAIPDGGSLLSKQVDNVRYYYGYTGIRVFDEQGKEIDLTQIPWFEMTELS